MVLSLNTDKQKNSFPGFLAEKFDLHLQVPVSALFLKKEIKGIEI